jgi:septal ring factor EnvC (AmiA/AmiB activator)
MALLLCTSCKNDAELDAKRQHQEAEIVRLQGEIALVKEKLGNMPSDKTSHLLTAESQLKDLAMEANRLEADVAELQQRKADLEKEFAKYKRKYPLD